MAEDEEGDGQGQKDEGTGEDEELLHGCKRGIHGRGLPVEIAGRFHGRRGQGTELRAEVETRGGGVVS